MAELSTVPLTDQIADYVRDQIYDKTFRPGQRISEQEIATAAGTSRGPVRDAFVMLEQEGLVERIPRRGTFVIQLTARDAYEIYGLRAMMEQLAVELVARHGNHTELEELSQIVDRMERSLQDESATEQSLTELDMDFHRGLLVASGHKRALDVWEDLAAQSHLLSLEARKMSSLDEIGITTLHRSIYEAVSERNVTVACRLVAQHLEGACAAIVRSLPGYNPKLPHRIWFPEMVLTVTSEGVEDAEKLSQGASVLAE